MAFTQAEFEHAYVTLGMSIFPVKARSKVPMTPHGFKDAVKDPQSYARLHQGRTHNIGLATGNASGVWVLDSDPRNRGDESIAKLIEQYGLLPTTWMAKTQGGGTHWYFAYRKNQPVGCRANLLPGLDIKGDGGYVLLPPSKVSGSYEWLNNPRVHPLAEAPQWLYNLVNVDKTGKSRGGGKLGRTNVDFTEGIHEGSRNNDFARLVGHLLRKNVDINLAWVLVRAYNIVYCHPSLDNRELERVFVSIARRELDSRERVLREI